MMFLTILLFVDSVHSWEQRQRQMCQYKDNNACGSPSELEVVLPLKALVWKLGPHMAI